jgi:hypothetical protein
VTGDRASLFEITIGLKSALEFRKLAGKVEVRVGRRGKKCCGGKVYVADVVTETFCNLLECSQWRV